MNNFFDKLQIANQFEILFVKIFGTKIHPPKDAIFEGYLVEVYKFGKSFYITNVRKN